MTTYIETCSQRIDGMAVSTLRRLGQQLKNWAKVQQLKIGVRRERQQLLEMSDAMLDDLGITRDQAREEARRVILPAIRVELLNRKIC